MTQVYLFNSIDINPSKKIGEVDHELPCVYQVAAYKNITWVDITSPARISYVYQGDVNRQKIPYNLHYFIFIETI